MTLVAGKSDQEVAKPRTHDGMVRTRPRIILMPQAPSGQHPGGRAPPVAQMCLYRSKVTGVAFVDQRQRRSEAQSRGSWRRAMTHRSMPAPAGRAPHQRKRTPVATGRRGHSRPGPLRRRAQRRRLVVAVVVSILAAGEAAVAATAHVPGRVNSTGATPAAAAVFEGTWVEPVTLGSGDIDRDCCTDW